MDNNISAYEAAQAQRPSVHSGWMVARLHCRDISTLLSAELVSYQGRDQINK